MLVDYSLQTIYSIKLYYDFFSARVEGNQCMNTLNKKEERISSFAHLKKRFTSWNPWKRVFFVLLITFFVACIAMLLVWIFPPPLILTSYPPSPPSFELANNWPISLPIAMVVLGVIATNLVFSTSEDRHFYLRFTTLLVCAETAILATAVAMSARMYWHMIFAPILNHSFPVELFPGVWLLTSISLFLGYQGFFLPILLIAGGAVMLFTIICESVF